MILITWWGLPQYAARAIGSFVRQCSEQVVVVSTLPAVPIRGMEEQIGGNVEWVTDEKSKSAQEGERLLQRLGEIPRVVVVCGWNLPMYMVIAKRVKKHGGKVIAVSDANYTFNFKQILRAVRFRLFLRKRFDFFFVPGASGRRLMRFFGVSNDRIYEGLYAADKRLFHDIVPITNRTKKIIYVGQFIERKNVLRLVAAFIRSSLSLSGWELELNGSGPYGSLLRKYAAQGVTVNDFVQPEQLVRRYNDARCFVLPSIEEHWGVVVHEAALCGCYLLLSKGIGAAADFATEINANMFNPFCVNEICQSLRRMAELSDRELCDAEVESVRLGRKVDLERFVEAMMRMSR